MSTRPEGSVCVVFRKSMKTTDLYTGWFVHVPPIGSFVEFKDRITTRFMKAKVVEQHWMLTGNPVLEPVTIVDLIIK